jgi:serine/threonine protein kinase
MPRNTFCGTLEYMSPEMITNGSHNHTLDVWCLGILLYELLHGHAPFRGGNYSIIYERIMKGKIRFKKSLPEDARDLIRKILQREANERLPLIKVFAHPWVLRLQKKHNLTKEPTVVKHPKKKAKEEGKFADYQEDFEDQKIPEEILDNKYFGEPNFGSNKKGLYKGKNDLAVNPNTLEQELLKIEEMETHKRKVLEEPVHKKFGGLLRPSPIAKPKKEYSHNENLLDLSQYEDHHKKSDIGFHPKFEKLQNIAGKVQERESQLPDMDDMDFGSKTKKQHGNQNFNETDGSKSPRPNFHNSSSDEDDMLDKLGKNMKDTSFIEDHKDFSNKFKNQKKKNEEILELIGGAHNDLDDIDVGEGHNINRNKSAFLSSYFDEDKYLQIPKYKDGEKILNAIDNYGVDEEYQHKLANANKILANNSDDSHDHERKSIGIVEHEHSQQIVRGEEDILGLDGPDEEISEPDKQEDFEFLKKWISHI